MISKIKKFFRAVAVLINTNGENMFASSEKGFGVKCADITCDKDAPHVVTYDLGNGMIGKAYYCIEHLSDGQKINPFSQQYKVRASQA